MLSRFFLRRYQNIQRTMATEEDGGSPRLERSSSTETDSDAPPAGNANLQSKNHKLAALLASVCPVSLFGCCWLCVCSRPRLPCHSAEDQPPPPITGCKVHHAPRVLHRAAQQLRECGTNTHTDTHTYECSLCDSRMREGALCTGQ